MQRHKSCILTWLLEFTRLICNLSKMIKINFKNNKNKFEILLVWIFLLVDFRKSFTLTLLTRHARIVLIFQCEKQINCISFKVCIYFSYFSIFFTFFVVVHTQWIINTFATCWYFVSLQSPASFDSFNWRKLEMYLR